MPLGGHRQRRIFRGDVSRRCATMLILGGIIMNALNSTLALIITAFVGVGCSGNVGGPGSSGGTTSIGGGGSSGTGGASGGITCGTVICATGQYCCNASCSMCAAPGVACIQIACLGTGGSGSGVGSCTNDSDCRTYDDYCRGCNCRAVPANIAVDPACGPSDMVSCLVEPCLNKRAVCSNGQCTVGG